MDFLIAIMALVALTLPTSLISAAVTVVVTRGWRKDPAVGQSAVVAMFGLIWIVVFSINERHDFFPVYHAKVVTLAALTQGCGVAVGPKLWVQHFDEADFGYCGTCDDSAPYDHREYRSRFCP